MNQSDYITPESLQLAEEALQGDDAACALQGDYDQHKESLAAIIGEIQRYYPEAKLCPAEGPQGAKVFNIQAGHFTLAYNFTQRVGAWSAAHSWTPQNVL